LRKNKIKEFIIYFFRFIEIEKSKKSKMGKLIKITCLNNNITKEYKLGKTLKEIAEDMQVNLRYPILGARVNNQLAELNYEIFKPKMVEFIDITNIDGFRMYQRSLSFVLMKAVKDLYPTYYLRIEHSISGGFYCELIGENFKLEQQNVLDIAERMREIVAQDIIFTREEYPTKEAIAMFEENGMFEKVKLFKSRPLLYTSIYKLENQIDYFYGYLVPSSSYVELFDLIPYYDGMLLRFPTLEKPDELGDILEQEKLFEIFREYKQWGKVLGVTTIGNVNEEVSKKNEGELIKIAEALHEKKLAGIADIIKNNKDTKIILVAGPSSSGKTTFAKRLSVQLKVSGLKPVQISLDNYFVDREFTPIDESGDFDFEAFEAIDVQTFTSNLIDLIAGKEVDLPHFSFEKGARFYPGDKLKITDENIIVIEGIHALNPNLSSHIDSKYKFKIYVSALTQIGIDMHNLIPTTDNRLLRRIIRDHQYRNYSALNTLKRWASVRRGENRNIFPFQEEADIMFNSALFFELGVLKRYAEPLLLQIDETEKEYSEAKRLLKFLSYFHPIPDKEIPPTSILREFLSGSSFHY